MNFSNYLITDETWQFICTEVTSAMPAFISEIPYKPWVFSLLGSVLIGLSGILPLLFIPVQTEEEKSRGSNRKFRDVCVSSSCCCWAIPVVDIW